MKNFVKCKLCLAMSEYVLLDMPLCEYHFVMLSNDLFSKDGKDIMPVLEKWLHE